MKALMHNSQQFPPGGNSAPIAFLIPAQRYKKKLHDLYRSL